MTELSSDRHSFPYLAAAQAQKDATHNEALALVDLAANPSALALGLDTPPPAPVPGQCWIVGSAPTGAWTGRAGALAGWTAGGWRFLAPIEGMRVWIAGARLWAVRDGGAWRLGEARCNQLIVGGNQVVGARQPAVPAPSGGTTVDVEARAAITSIIERLVAHGLIGNGG
jgi:hypothetical protein